MAKLRKKVLKEGYVYVVDFRNRGKRHVISTGTDDKRLAMQVLKELEGKVVKGVFKLEDYNNKSIRLNEFFEEYFKYAVGLKGAVTILNERNYVKKFLAFAGNREISSVDVKLLDQWKTRLLMDVSPTTFNIEKSALQAMFSIAVKWGHINQNPFKGVKKLKIGQKRLYLTAEELNKVFNLIKKDIQHAEGIQQGYNKKFFLLILFMLNTGIRRSEASRLHKRNIDMDRGLIILEKTKSKKTRVIPMNQVVQKIIRELDDTMFMDMNIASVTHKFKGYLTRAGLQGFKLHSLRHTFATSLIANKMDLYTAVYCWVILIYAHQ
jgi:integrase